MGDRTGVQKWSLLLCVFSGRCIKKCINIEYMTTLAIAGSTAPQAGHLQKPSKTKGKSHQNPRATESEPSFLPCCLSSFHPSFLASFLPSFLPSWLRTFLPSFLPCLSLFLFFIFFIDAFLFFFLMHLYFLLMHFYFFFDASPEHDAQRLFIIFIKLSSQRCQPPFLEPSSESR